MSNRPSNVEILFFARENGARELHRSWRDNMLEQGRQVPPGRMKWETLSEQDKELDFEIANDLYQDFYTWLKEHYPKDNDLIRSDEDE